MTVVKSREANQSRLDREEELLPATTRERSIWQIPLASLRPGLMVVVAVTGLILLQPLMAVLGNLAFALGIFAWYYRGLTRKEQQQLERRSVGWLRQGLRVLRGAPPRQKRGS